VTVVGCVALIVKYFVSKSVSSSFSIAIPSL
jgi:hypothetical protein